jgi:DNA-binding PadR family transcriptional regulator
MQNFRLPPYGTEGPFNEPSDQEKPIFPTVTQLPGGGTRLGAVIGPIFHIPEHLGAGLENVGVFGRPGSGKTYIMMAIALHTMLNGNLAWIFDVDNEFSCLADVIPEPYKPVIITPEHLRINFFQPPNDLIKLVLWLETIAFLLRSETFIRNGGQNLFNTSLSQLLKNKGPAGSRQYPSLAETLCHFQGLRLSEPEVCDKGRLESPVNRITMLCDTFEKTARVTKSNMLKLLANRSVIFRLHNIRGIPLKFLTKFLLMWLSKYRQDAANTKKLQTLFFNEQHLSRAEKGRNDIGSAALEELFAAGLKRGLRVVLSNQIVSHSKNHILGNLECSIITRLTNPRDIWHIQQSMGLSHAQTRSIPQLKKREAIVSYGGYPTPFKVRIDDFSFPPKQDEIVLERNAHAFLSQVYWYEDSGLEGSVELPEIITGDTLKVFIRIAEVAETVAERCDGLQMDRGSEVQARRVLEAKGYIVQEEIIVGNKLRFYKLTPKGAEWAKSQGIKVRHFESGPVHEYLLDQIEQKIDALNPQYKFQRNSDIGQEHGIHPDLVLIQPRAHQMIIEIICCNVDHEAKTLVKERGIDGVKVVIAVVPNQYVKKALQCALERCQIGGSDNAESEKLVVLDAGKCLSPKFDWISVFERP